MEVDGGRWGWMEVVFNCDLWGIVGMEFLSGVCVLIVVCDHDKTELYG